MQLFLDTAEINEISMRVNSGFIDGVTTNPSLIAQSGANIFDRLNEICSVITGPISAEVVATSYDNMVTEGISLSRIAPNIVVKLPLTLDGLKACQTLTAKDIRTNITLCFSTNQAWLAAKAGASFISPFVGRIDDVGGDGIGLLANIRTLYDNFGYTTKILAASLRSPAHVEQAALVGSDAATIPVKIFDQLYIHPQTEKGLEAFLTDWSNAGHGRISQSDQHGD